MQFEWDEKKRRAVWRERGIDFEDLALIFENPEELLVWEDPRHPGEKRFTAIGRVGADWYSVTYEERGDVYRLITGWKLNDKSKRRDQARLARRAARKERPG